MPEFLRGQLYPSMPTPIDPGGQLHGEGLNCLIAWLSGHPVGGVAVGIAMGRGPDLDPKTWALVLGAWREGLGAGRLLIAGVGPGPGIRRPEDVFDAVRTMAGATAKLGADVLLVLPPGSFRGRPDRDRLVLEYHAIAAEAGVPLLVSYRREASGGVAYGPDVLAQLLARTDVLGIEIATIDRIIAFQQVARLVREQAPGKRVISGEERFLGYSLMSGADTAMVGLGAIYPGEVAGLVEAHDSGDAGRFLKLSAILDDRARSIFRAPMEGATRRLLDALVQRGVLPADAANDPWGSGRAPGNGGEVPSRWE